MSVKFTQLPSATVPLVGDEILALVQDGESRQVPAVAVGGGGVVTAALAAGQTDDLVIAGINSANRVVLTLAGDATLTGIVPPSDPDGRRLMIVNGSGANVLTLMTAFGSAAANQFASNGDLIVPPLCGAEYIYDATNSRWVKT